MIAFATLGVFSLYYDTPIGEYVELAAAVFALTALVIGISLVRASLFMRPVSRWIASSERRDNPVLATRAWEAAVGVPFAVAVREMVWPVVFVAIPGVIGSIIVFDFNPLSAIPLMAGSLIAIGTEVFFTTSAWRVACGRCSRTSTGSMPRGRVPR